MQPPGADDRESEFLYLLLSTDPRVIGDLGHLRLRTATGPLGACHGPFRGQWHASMPWFGNSFGNSFEN